MTNNQLTKEWLQQTIAELESVRDEIPFGIDTNSELELAAFKMALAAMDSEPVAWMSKGGTVLNGMRQSAHDFAHYNIPLYRHAQPAPAVPDEMTPEMMRAVQLNSELGEYAASNLSGAYGLFAEFWRVACRAAMLQAEPVTTANKLGNSPVIGIDPASVPDRTVEVRYVAPPGFVLVPKEPTEEMNKAGWAAMNEHDAINPTYRAMLAAAPHDTPALNSVQSGVTVSDTWIPVSERMPENDVSVLTFDGMYKRVHHAMYGHWQCWEPGKITHWMPLPADPQEVIGIDLANGKDASVEVVIENGKVISHG